MSTLNRFRRRAVFFLPVLIVLAGPAFSQDQDEEQGPGKIDVSHYDIDAKVEPERAFIQGEARIRFRVLEDTLTLPFRLNSRLVLTEVSDENERYSSRYTDFGSDNMLVRGEGPFLAGNEYTLRFVFEGTLDTEQYAFLDTPESSPAFINREGAVLQSQGNWFPAHDPPLDTAPVRLRVTVPLGFTVVAPGELLPIETLGVDEAFTWVSESPLGEVPVVVARFLRERFDDAPIPLTFFVREDYDRKVAESVPDIGKITEFYLREYGVPLAEGLSLAQAGKVILSGKGSQGLMLIEDDLSKAPQVPVFDLARRLALQWWGYSARLESYQDAWLADGFAAYSALRYLQSIDPERFSAELTMQAVEALKYQDKSPISDGLLLEPGTPQYDSIVASKGAWTLYMLSQLVGQDTFHALLKDWFQQIRGGSATTSAFHQLVEQRSGKDLDWFFSQWVESVGVPEFRVDYTVFKRKDGTYRIQGQIKQDLDLFRMPVDLLIETKGNPEEKLLDVQGRQTSFNFITQTMPQRIKFDPAGKILIDSEQMRMRVHIAMGDEFQKQNELVAAVTEYEKAKIEDPRSSLVHYRLGETYFLQTSFNLAANSFRDALNGDLKPDWVETWSYIHLGKIYDVLGQRQRAMAEYQKAINTDIDYNGAQAEARKYLKTAFTKPSNMIN